MPELTDQPRKSRRGRTTDPSAPAAETRAASGGSYRRPKTGGAFERTESTLQLDDPDHPSRLAEAPAPTPEPPSQE